jgi:TolB-like protein
MYREVSFTEELHSVAVMPFENPAERADVQYLCDGIAESLINWLATMPDMRVVSKTASFRLRDQSDDIAAIAEALGVDSVVTGRLEQVGDQVVVSASLVDVRDDTQLWGERLVHPADQVLALERSIVSALTSGLSLTVGEVPLTGEGHTDSPEAYQHYLRGHYLIQGTNSDSILQGLDELRAAIRFDPNYARPYADIADSLSQMLFYGMVEGEALLGEARNAAYTAVALAPELAEAQTALATMRQYFEFDWTAVDAAYEKAISLEPQSPVPFHRYSDYLAFTLRFDRSREMARRAIAIDPLDGSSMHAVGIAELMAGHFAEAANALGEWNRFYPQSRWSYIKHGVALALDDQCEAALGQVNAVENLTAGRMSALAKSWNLWTRKVCGDAKWHSRAEALLEEQQEYAPDRLTAGNVYLLLLLGRTDELIARMTATVEARDPIIMFLPTYGLKYPGWETHLASDPRYQELMEPLNFPPADVISLTQD